MFDDYGNWIPNGGSRFATPMFQGNAFAGIGDVSGVGNIGPSVMGHDQVSAGMPSFTGDLGGMPALAVNPAAGGSIWDNFLSKPGQQGWGGMALGAASGLFNGFLGMQQLGVAKDTLAQNKRQFDLNFGAQQKMTNSRLADRQATRVASGYSNTSVNDYMKQYGI